MYLVDGGADALGEVVVVQRRRVRVPTHPSPHRHTANVSNRLAVDCVSAHHAPCIDKAG
jgi:hypothetical protein